MLAKGFIRIIEVVIFSFILFVLLMPTFFHYSYINDWSKANSLLLCNDLLYSIERNGTFNDVLITDPFTDGNNLMEEYEKDIGLLYNITEKVFPVSVDFEYEIKNVAPYNISIGCNCTEDEKEWLKEKILTPSYPTVEFDILRVSLNNLSSEYNLFIIFGDKNLSLYKSNITSLLRKGKGFVLIRNFSSEPDSFTKELFGINYSSALGPFPEEDLTFTNLSNKRTAGIAKRFINNLIRINTTGGTGKLHLKNKTYDVNISGNFVNITNCSNTISEGETCTISGVANITLYQIDPLSKDWIDIKIAADNTNKRNYIFRDNFPKTVEKNNYTILSSGTNSGANARVLKNYSNSYENEPRVFWIYDYDKNKDDLNLLLKTGIIWASGEHYFIFNKKIPEKRDYCIHFYFGLRDNNIPFIVKLYFFGY